MQNRLDLQQAHIVNNSGLFDHSQNSYQLSVNHEVFVASGILQ